MRYRICQGHGVARADGDMMDLLVPGWRVHVGGRVLAGSVPTGQAERGSPLLIIFGFRVFLPDAGARHLPLPSLRR